MSIPIESIWSNTEPTHTAAAAENGTIELANLTVYGLLTDLAIFEFYSYDPVEKQFYLDEKLYLDIRRDYFCFGMIHGSFNAVKKVAIIDVFVSSHE